MNHPFTAGAFLCWLIAAAGAVTVGCQAAASPPQRSTLSVEVYRVAYPRIRSILAAAFGKALPNTEIHIRESANAVEDIGRLQRGETDVSFAFADLAYLAYVGQLDGHPTSYDELRGIAVLQPNPVLLLVRPRLDIRDFSGLSGHRVGIGLAGTSADLTAGFILKALNLQVERVRIGPLEEALAALTRGQVDAIFVIASYSPLIPDAIRAGVRVLSLSGPTIDRIRLEHQFFRRIVIPPGVYGPGEVRTIAIDRLLVCRHGLEERAVYAITRAFFDVLPTLTAIEISMKDFDIEGAPATPIPLHPGAARYYREREWER